MEDAEQPGFRWVKVELRLFERGELFDGKVCWEAFDGEVRRIVGHSMGSFRLLWRVLIHIGGAADR